MSADSAERYRLDRFPVRALSNRAAPHYEQHAAVPRELEDRLLEHLDPIRLAPARILDFGAGIGTLARSLARRFRRAEIVVLDAASAMLREGRRRAPRFRSRQRFVCADMEALPLGDASVDLAISNAALPWATSPDAALLELARVLRPGGLLLFSSLGPDTLRELRESWASVDGAVHVHAFLDMHDLGDALVRAGFADVVMDADRIVASYTALEDLLVQLKGLGATNASTGRNRGLASPRRLRGLRAAYENHRRADGSLPVTIEAVFAHGWRRAERGSLPIAFDPGTESGRRAGP